MSKELRGIDLSKYQNGTIDYKKAKAAGVDFAILKIVQGVNTATIEPSFEKHWSGCKNAGIEVKGVYIYSYALTEGRAVADAKKIVSILNGRKVKVWLDVEDPKIAGKGQHLIDAMKYFQKYIESAGLEFGIYTGQSWYNTNIKPFTSQFPNMKYWIASYGKNVDGVKINAKVTRAMPTVDNGTVEIWQHSSKGAVDGFKTNIDLNIMYVEEEKKKEVVPVPEPKKEEEVTPPVTPSKPSTVTELKFDMSKINIIPKTKNDLVKLGQAYLNQALASYGYKLSIDGSRGPLTKNAEKALVLLCVNLEKKTNYDISSPDKEISTAVKLINTKKGSKNYFNTALEIICLTHGVNPNGVETPGSYGDGLSNAVSSILGKIVELVTGKHVTELLK